MPVIDVMIDALMHSCTDALMDGFYSVVCRCCSLTCRGSRREPTKLVPEYLPGHDEVG